MMASSPLLEAASFIRVAGVQQVSRLLDAYFVLGTLLTGHVACINSFNPPGSPMR